MYTIEYEKECSCLKKSELGEKLTFESREDMINKARVLEFLMNQNFCISNEKIYFGLTDIKNVGLSVYKKLVKLNEDYPIKNLCWTQCLFMILDNITSTAAKALISCGALDIYNKSRTYMLFEYEMISELTKR